MACVLFCVPRNNVVGDFILCY